MPGRGEDFVTKGREKGQGVVVVLWHFSLSLPRVARLFIFQTKLMILM